MTSGVVSPVRVTARLDAPLSRWLWLVKWLLVLPHVLVLAFLWVAFAVLSVVAFFAILITGRYPPAIFEFNVGVLRWSWRVGYYAYGALGTDRYPPFTLREVPDYAATLEIAYPEHLSRGLVLVKWWLLALPHYLVIAFFMGGGTYVAYQSGTWTTQTDPDGVWSFAGGLIGLLAFFAAIALLFTGRYPRGVFDLLLGMHRWVLRVAAYAALMTDAYPPFRLDMGGSESAALAVTEGSTAPTASQVSSTTPEPPQHRGWTAGRIVTVVIGSVLLVCGVGSAAGGTALLVADQAGRDAGGFLGTPTRQFTSSGYALVFDPVELRDDAGTVDLGAVLGDLRVRAAGQDADGVFVGIGPAADVERYLGTVDRERLVDITDEGRAVQQRIPGGEPAAPPAQQPFWAASASGPGEQQLVWRAADGRWSVVVMNADATRPMIADLSAALTAPALRWVWIGLFIGAGIALLVGALLVAVAVPRRVTR
ncbi:hypothetical protein BJF90_35250 [Pseudonocardia sp. CNS-004]|nr:hypothetical protein BJF90_35250 [Pseudonocardia sp. CNS-004]